MTIDDERVIKDDASIPASIVTNPCCTHIIRHAGKPSGRLSSVLLAISNKAGRNIRDSSALKPLICAFPLFGVDAVDAELFVVEEEELLSVVSLVRNNGTQEKAFRNVCDWAEAGLFVVALIFGVTVRGVDTLLLLFTSRVVFVVVLTGGHTGPRHPLETGTITVVFFCSSFEFSIDLYPEATNKFPSVSRYEKEI